ncbi:uncharacterized protein N7469_005727 [Penicillium citrinum]|uniref:NADH:ubiquinone oxidoreductase intermediate-associated protein 30 domain-containing protein n=2 Tax=Penicillium TaxID=5073 RepID=A0A9W9TPA7_PENCI|nr:uncharacterized protein N7469_005727 [Penicillium citrinum]KAJ5233961.1 hypothetical protein N7469_005727 [Penicillium citrinum]KAJ5572556.1 hypothetical protein N7450_009540 [Penicillium hetheringtonii]
MAPTSHLPLFGGVRAWNQDDWTSSDDRVRGGSSHSTLSCSPSSLTARFHGNLDITTLGGAGFASQRTRGEGRTWDLSRHDGLEIVVDRADGKVYTLTLKDEILPKRPDGREQSTVSWEFDFRAERRTTIFVKWEDFRPTYRGKDKKDTEPLDLKNIKRFGIMVRSFFGEQEGPFELDIISIAAVRTERYLDDPNDENLDQYMNEKQDSMRSFRGRRGWLGSIFRCFGF